MKIDLGYPGGTQAEVMRSGDGRMSVSGPYSNLETLSLAAKHFDRMQERNKLCRLQGNEPNLND